MLQIMPMPWLTCLSRYYLDFYFQTVETESAMKHEFQFCHCQVLDSRLYVGETKSLMLSNFCACAKTFFLLLTIYDVNMYQAEILMLKKLYVPCYIYPDIFIIIFI